MDNKTHTVIAAIVFTFSLVATKVAITFNQVPYAETLNSLHAQGAMGVALFFWIAIVAALLLSGRQLIASYLNYSR